MSISALCHPGYINKDKYSSSQWIKCDSFRLLLQTPKPGSATSPNPVSTAAKPKSIDASQPAFKPRKVKKTSESKYRDRAGERRQGGGNDYAEVEAVLEEFERRHANNADKDEKRKYLGGDSEHSILVKGLDMALLEANKAKAVPLSIEDDDTLEKAFTEQELTSTSELNVVPKKRTREDLIRELKEKRQTQATDNHTASEERTKVFEEAKKVGKFRPIGFKPIVEEKPKKIKAKDEAKDGQRKKKKRKVDEDQTKTAAKDIDNSAPPVPAVSNHSVTPASIVTVSKTQAQEQEPEPFPEEFDIFADVGEYEGLDLGGEVEGDTKQAVHEGPASVIPQRWIAMEEEDLSPELPGNESLSLKLHSPPRHRSRSPDHNGRPIPEAAEMEDEKPVRLQPLESSALPSIKDFLALQEAAEAEDKRKKRKEKKKAKANKESP
ncbi:hypothetical protein APHAL10511_004289 [Amanita phalloides]|nr:hypothetical protein APHAL10511_004289 [Amanita phalloides]